MDLGKFSLIFTVFFLLLSMANTETIEVRNALVQFMQTLSPRNNKKELNFGWNTTSDPCNDNWKGITCYNNSSTIKKIVLDQLNFTGQLDASSLCVTKSLTVLSLNSNNIFGSFSEEISKCTRLTHIYLHGNKFSGNPPNSLSQLSNLKRLDISDNGFSGDIPDVSRISGLLTFLAENNQLSGSIPNFDFSNLQDFNVSNNNLSGPIPDIGGYFNGTSFLGNRGLCGRPLVNSCLPPPPVKKNGSSKKDYFIYSGFGAMGLVIICLIVFMLIKKDKRKKKKYIDDNVSSTSSESKGARGNRSEYSITSAESAKSSPSLIVLSNPKGNELKFEDLLRSPAELIARGKHGSLYKVTTHEGVNLAVKRIRHWDISRDNFTKRMRCIDQLKHPNVIPIVAFYCSKQEKLLVYEFQQNSSLFSLLHGSKNSRSFDWGNRLNVAAKISKALAFMHEGIQANGIPHGNLKSSNILMNNQMEPCLSEYGLVETENQDQFAQIDSFEEHGSQMNAFGADTYSFGVILLELLTGKLVQNNGFDLARWVNSAIREEWTVEVFDKELVVEGANEERMVSLLQVALKCINSSSEARPRIEEVALMINTIKEYEEKNISSDT